MAMECEKERELLNVKEVNEMKEIKLKKNGNRM